MGSSSTYTQSRQFFLKTLERMENDLDEYKKQPAAKPRYIDKQTSIIKNMRQYFEANEEFVSLSSKMESEHGKQVSDFQRVINNLMCVCQIVHINPFELAKCFSHDGRWRDHLIKDTLDAHMLVCDNPMHEKMKKFFEETPGTMLHQDKESREFIKSIESKHQG